MTTPEANWIKLPTKKPSGDSLLLWDTTHPDCPGFAKQANGITLAFTRSSECSWHPAIIAWMPAPPRPKVETQRERDYAVFVDRYGKCLDDFPWSKQLAAFEFALASERAWFRAELAKLSRLSVACSLGEVCAQAYDRMVERCKEEGM